MHRKHTTAEDGMQSARSVSHSGKTLRWYLSFRPVAVLAAAFAATLTTGLVAGSLGAGIAGAEVVGHATAVTSGTYVPLTPARITDTRAASGFPNAGSTLTAGGTLNVTVEGAGGVPTSGVAAVVLNVTAVNETASSYVSVYPEGGSLPTVSNLNTTAGDTVTNLVTVAVGTSGGVTVYNHTGSTDIVVDVEGYYTTTVGTSGLYDAVTPDRVLGTLAAGTPIAAGVSTPVTVTGGSTGVPSDAKAVVFNLTASAGTASSYLTAYPAGGTEPTASNLNFAAGQVVANRVTVPVGTGGQVEIYNYAGTAAVDVDLDGYYTGSSTEAGSSFVALAAPTRLVDTRTSTGGTAIASDSTESFSFASDSSIPSTATAVAGDVTVVAGNAPGFLTVYPTTDATPPTASDVNWTANGIVPNFTEIPLNSSAVDIFNSTGATTNVVIDAFGYFAPVTIPTYTVTPAAAQSASFSTAAAPTQGSTTYTATGFTAGQLVDITLFPGTGNVNAPTTSTAGAPTFVPNGAGNASGQMTTSSTSPDVAAGCIAAAACTGYIASVNGVPETAAATQIPNVAANSSGTITFTVNSFAIDSATPVVFTVPTSNTTGLLAVNLNGTPATGYEVGIAGAVTFGPPTPNAGTNTYNGEFVQTVNTTAQTFTACTSATVFTATTCNTFSYATSGDTFTYDEGTVPGVSESNFALYLSGEIPAFDAGGVTSFVPGDELNIDNSLIGPSSFTFVRDVPAAPTGITTSVNGAGQVVVAWTAPPNPDTYSYTVLRATVPTSGIVTPASFVAFANNTVTGNDAADMLLPGAVPPVTTVTDSTVTPGTTYEYEVEATSDNTNGPSTGATSTPSAQVTPPATATAAFAPLATSTGFALGNTSDTAGALQAGDTFTVGFAGPVTLNSTAFSLTVSDGTNTAVLTPSNSTLTQGSSSSSVVYTVSANSIPGTPGPIAFSGAQPLEVTAQSGVSNSVGPWNVAGSLAVNGAYTDTFDGAKTLVATATGAATTPAITAQAAGLGSTTVTVTGTTSGDTVNVYNENGTVLGTAVAAGASTAVTTSSTVTTATVLVATQQKPGGYLSESAVTTGWSAVPVATTGSLTTPGTNVHLVASTLPLLSVTYSSSATPNGSFYINGSTTAVPTGGVTVASSSTGTTAVVYTSGATLTGSKADIITASNGSATTNPTSYTTGP